MSNAEKQAVKREQTKEELRLKGDLDISRDEYAKAFRQISHTVVKNNAFKKIYSVTERKQHKFRELEDEYIQENPQSPLKVLRDDYEKKRDAYLAIVLREGGEQEALYHHRLEAATVINTKLRFRAVAMMGRVVATGVKYVIGSENFKKTAQWTKEFLDAHPKLAALGIVVVAFATLLTLPTTWLAAFAVGAGTGIAYRIAGGMDVEDYLQGKSGWLHTFKTEDERIEYAAKLQRNTKVKASALALSFGGMMRALRTSLATELGIDRGASLFRKMAGDFWDQIVRTAKKATEINPLHELSQVSLISPAEAHPITGASNQGGQGGGATELAYESRPESASSPSDYLNDPEYIRSFNETESTYAFFEEWGRIASYEYTQKQLAKLDALIRSGMQGVAEIKARYLADLNAYNDLMGNIQTHFDKLTWMQQNGSLYDFKNHRYFEGIDWRKLNLPPPEEMERMFRERPRLTQELANLKRQAPELARRVRQGNAIIENLPKPNEKLVGVSQLSADVRTADQGFGASFLNTSDLQSSGSDSSHFQELVANLNTVLDRLEGIVASTTQEQFKIGRFLQGLHDFETRFMEAKLTPGTNASLWQSIYEGDYRKLLGLEEKLNALSQEYADLGGKAEDITNELNAEDITPDDAEKRLAPLKKDLAALNIKRDALLNQIDDTRKAIESKIKIPPSFNDGVGPESALQGDTGTRKVSANDIGQFQEMGYQDNPRLRGTQAPDTYQTPDTLTPQEWAEAKRLVETRFSTFREWVFRQYPTDFEELFKRLPNPPHEAEGQALAEEISRVQSRIAGILNVYYSAMVEGLRHPNGTTVDSVTSRIYEDLDKIPDNQELRELLAKLHRLDVQANDMVNSTLPGRGPNVINAGWDGNGGEQGFQLAADHGVTKPTFSYSDRIGKLENLTPQLRALFEQNGIENLSVGDIKGPDAVQIYQKLLNEQLFKLNLVKPGMIARLEQLQAIAEGDSRVTPGAVAALQFQLATDLGQAGKGIASSVDIFSSYKDLSLLEAGKLDELRNKAARAIFNAWSPIQELDKKIAALEELSKNEGVQRAIPPKGGSLDV